MLKMVITMKNKIGLTKIYLTTVLLLSINQTYADQGNKVKIKVIVLEILK